MRWDDTYLIPLFYKFYSSEVKSSVFITNLSGYFYLLQRVEKKVKNFTERERTKKKQDVEKMW